MRHLFEKKYVKYLCGALLVAIAVFTGYILAGPSYIEADGHIDAYSISVSSPILGTMTHRYADEGDLLKENQVLFQLDDRLLSAKKNQAKTRLKYAREEWEQKKVYSEIVMQEYLNARIDFDQNQISSQELNQHLRKMEETQVALQSLQSGIANLEADLQVIEVEMEKSRILSPCEAVVVKSWLLPGSVVGPQDPVFTLYDLEHLWINAEIDEKDIRNVQVGSRVEIYLESYPKEKLKGKVAFISPAILSIHSKKIPVKIDIASSKDIVLRPGMSVQTKIFTTKTL